MAVSGGHGNLRVPAVQNILVVTSIRRGRSLCHGHPL